MSRERELLMKVCKFLDSDVENNYGLVSEIRSLLAQPNEEKLTMTQRLEEYKKGYARAEQRLKREQEPDYAWSTVADYEKEVGFEVSDAFKAAWDMARTRLSYESTAHGIGIDDEHDDA